MLDVSPTPNKLIKQALAIYGQEGLKYVYAGNLDD